MRDKTPPHDVATRDNPSSGRLSESEKVIAKWLDLWIGYFPAFNEVAGEDVLGLYVVELREIDAAVLDEAMRACVRSCKRFPLIADVLAAVDAVRAARSRASANSRQDPDPACPECAGSGWRQNPAAHFLPVPVVERCPCTEAGAARRAPLPDSPVDVKALFDDALQHHAESHDLNLNLKQEKKT